MSTRGKRVSVGREVAREAVAWAHGVRIAGVADGSGRAGALGAFGGTTNRALRYGATVVVRVCLT